MSEADPTWIDVVGYRYEFLHTGVLQWLLESREHAAPVARELTGLSGITFIGRVTPQGHAGVTGPPSSVHPL